MELIRERLKIEEYNYPFADKVKSQLQSQITLLSASGPSNINAQFTGWELQGKEVDNIIKWISNLITKDFVPDGGFTLKCSGPRAGVGSVVAGHRAVQCLPHCIAGRALIVVKRCSVECR